MRGVSGAFLYSVGSQVLCFEPDPNKAKIIYHAKILRQKGFVTDNRVKRALYQVHFQGWKDKWDREVTENMLLEDSAFNRELKLRIEEVAKKVKNKEIRRERIDQILTAASSAAKEDIFDWSVIPGVWTEQEDCRSKSKALLTHNGCFYEGNGGYSGYLTKSDSGTISALGDDLDPDDLGMTDDTDFGEGTNAGLSEDDELHLNFTPQLNLTDRLKEVLESDMNRVKSPSQHQCKQEASSHSVLDLLQSYLDTFPYDESEDTSHILPMDTDNEETSSLREEYSEADRNRILCAEVCSGLLTLFNFLLKDHLLYHEERDQKIRITTRPNKMLRNSPQFFRCLESLKKCQSVNWSACSSLAGEMTHTHADYALPMEAKSSQEVGPTHPPLKKHRTELSLLSAISTTVGVDPTGAPYYQPDDPYLLYNRSSRNYCLSKASGIATARFFLQDQPKVFAGLRREVPFLWRLGPLLNPSDVQESLDQGTMTHDEAVMALVDLVKPEEAWQLYLTAEDSAVSPETTQALLELLCSTNGDTYSLDVPSFELFYTWDQLPVNRTLNTLLHTRDESKALISRSKSGEELETKKPESKDRKRIWKTNGAAEDLFVKLPQKTQLAYQSMIRGASKHYDAPRAFQLSEEMTQAGHTKDLATYNALLRCAGHLEEDDASVEERVKSLLSEIHNSGLHPTLATFNNALVAMCSIGNSESRNSLGFGLLKEMDHLGVEPTLGTYAILVKLTCYAKKDVRTCCANLMEILDRVEARDTSLHEELTTSDDYQFFVFAMQSALIICNADLTLSNRIEALRQRGGRMSMIGSYSSDMWYHIYYFQCLIRRATLDQVMTVWNRIVPFYFDRGLFMGSLLSNIEQENHFEHLLTVWKQSLSFRTFVVYCHKAKSPIYIIPHVLNYLSRNPQIPDPVIREAMQSLEETYRNSATHSKHDLNRKITKENVKAAIQLCIRAGDIDTAVRLTEDAAENKLPLTPACLVHVAEECLVKGRSSDAANCLASLSRVSSRKLVAIGLPDLQSLLTSVENTGSKSLSDRQVIMLKELKARLSLITVDQKNLHSDSESSQSNSSSSSSSSDSD